MLRSLLNFEFRKALPREFGSGRVFVTGRADARVLKPGWNGAAFDLQLVARNILQEGMCVWDIGANQGIFSFLSAFKVGSQGAVYALEADPKYADMVYRSCERLPNSYQNINVLCAAISEKRGVLEFGVSGSGHARNGLLQHAREGFDVKSTKSVVSVTGDELLDNWRSPDLIKIDVEGAEFAALIGSEKLFSVSRPIFYIEVSDEAAEHVSGFFHDRDYELFHLKGDGSEIPVATCTFYTVARPRLIQT